jgi:hypothetical protein
VLDVERLAARSSRDRLALEQGGDSTGVLLAEDLEVLVDDGDREQDSGTGTDGSHEVGEHGEGTNAHSTEGGGNWDVLVQHTHQASVAVAFHDHVLVAQLLGNVARGRARHFDPGLTEQGATGQDERQVEDGTERIAQYRGQAPWWGNVVRQPTDGDALALAALDVLPPSEQTDDDVGRVAFVQELRDEVQVGHQSGLQDDRHVAGVEQFDRVGPLLATLLVVLDWELQTEPLEVDDDQEHHDGGQQVQDVGHVLAVEGFLQGADLVVLRDQQVEQGDDGALELGATASVDGGRGEGLPYDVFADVGRDEQGDPGPQAVPFLQELVEDDDDDPGAEQLDNDQDGVTGAEAVLATDLSVHSRQHVCDGFADCDQDTEQFLCALEVVAVFLYALVDFDDLRPGQELHYHTGGDDRGDTQLHQGTTVGGKDDTHPVERVGPAPHLDAVQWNLTAHQEDEQGDDRP